MVFLRQPHLTRPTLSSHTSDVLLHSDVLVIILQHFIVFILHLIVHLHHLHTLRHLSCQFKSRVCQDFICQFKSLHQKNFTDAYKRKSVGKMVDFKILTLCISLNSSQLCTYFCKDLQYNPTNSNPEGKPKPFRGNGG